MRSNGGKKEENLLPSDTRGEEDPLEDGFGRCNPRAPHRGGAHAKSTETQRFEAFIRSHDLLTSLSLVAFVVESGAQQQHGVVL